MQKDQKHQTDEEFELLLKQFIDDALDSDDEPTPVEPELPFPKEISDKVAEGMMTLNHEDHNYLDDVASIEVDVLPGCNDGLYNEGSIAVTLRAKRGVNLKKTPIHLLYLYRHLLPDVRKCEKREKGLHAQVHRHDPLPENLAPGKYILFVHDELDDTLQRIDFSLDDRLNVSSGDPELCLYSGVEHTMTSCLQTSDSGWSYLAGQPGMAQFRRRVMNVRHLLLFNEFRKDVGQKALSTNENYLICTRNNDLTPEVVRAFQSLVAFDYGFSHVDCTTLFDLSRSNPFEPLTEQLSEADRKVLCLTHLNELATSNGKLCMRKILDRVRESNGSTLLWLCGTRQEIDELLNLFPSLRQFFTTNSYVEQEPYTAFELVQAFFDELRKENLESDMVVRNKLSQTILQGWEQGALTNWTLSDIRRFIADEIMPRYLERAMPLMENYETTLLSEGDIPFDKLTATGSAFEESMRELNAMIGLDSVKQGIMTMANQTRLSLERRRRGLKANGNLVFHSIFTGNPGTGKTTVARQLGKLYHALGLLSKGEVIAVDRTRLVGQYIGQTEENMKVILEEAKGNVLFVDEAYTLYTGTDDNKDFRTPRT